MEEKFYITLNCWECDHPFCGLGRIVNENTREGCVRQVDEGLFIEYYHQLKEVWPFISKSKNKETIDKEYKKTMDVLDKIYNSPCTKQYGKGFKVIVGV